MSGIGRIIDAFRKRPRPPGPVPVPVDPAPPDPGPPGPAPDQPGAVGGFAVHSSDPSVRRPLSASAIAAFLPNRGGFTFPAPYGTTGVRLTNWEDGEILPVGYAYWSNVNAHAGHPSLMAFVGRAGLPPLVLGVEKATLAVAPIAEAPIAGTGEGWYWSRRDPSLLYVTDGARLLRWRVGGSLDVAFDVRDQFGQDAHVKQVHSSADGTVHSATLLDANWQAKGAVVFGPGSLVRTFAPQGGYDECQVDKSGRWLLIKEGGDDNRIVDLVAGDEWTVLNVGGAVGHSDMGYGYVVGEDDHAGEPGAVRIWRFTDAGPVDGGLACYTTDWATTARHVAHGNAPRPYVVVSGATRADVPRANEIVRAPLDGSHVVTVLAPNLVDLDAPGGGEEYWKAPHANVDAAGEWAMWTANCGSSRLDAFLVRVG